MSGGKTVAIVNDTMRKKELSETFYGKVILIFLSFLFTTLLGTYFTSKIQQQHNMYTLKINELSRLIERKEQCFYEISTAIDSRVYLARKVIDSDFVVYLKPKKNDLINDYLEQMFYINMNKNRFLSSVRFYYGDDIANELAGFFDDLFEMHKEVEQIITNRSNKDYNYYLDLYTKMNTKVSVINDKFLASLNSTSLHW